MSTTIVATYDGEVFRPNSRLQLEPNTMVRLTIESLNHGANERLPQDYPEADFYTAIEYSWVDSLYTVDQALASFGGQTHAHR